ncbi:hypothetical protein BO85DRAFT_246100 [Aspergillus piperis CBS 112811]|uniref:Stc1 domain-containing protein n=1 Tax=Aspergillus piperis CBS 112811 TaxID=1448313 RepID=A0A8G1R6J4_9EURO|nr:hypothetical protein BO85DRAFT_246100 [Aspergillus piperis CBS 112811]RAH59596.1 hypothetical protein BO85DRAFT_246100 [Aspergillus piperis CBS 112811]
MGPSRRAKVVPNAFAGGYSQTVKNRLDKVVFPDRIKCGTCKKFRFIGTFSNRQLDILRHAVVADGVSPVTSGIARCRQCTGPGNTELKCSQCDRVKSIEEFAKNQRQERDTARCMNCVQKHTETEPLIDELKQITGGDDTTASSVTAGSSSMAVSFKRLQLTGAHEGSGYSDDEDDDDDLSVGGGVFLEPGHTDENSSTNKGKERVFTGYDPQGNPHVLTHRAEATQSYESEWSVWGVKSKASRSEAGPARATPKKESKFAKIPRTIYEKGELPSMAIPDASGANIPSDDEEEENDLDGFL